MCLSFVLLREKEEEEEDCERLYGVLRAWPRGAPRSGTTAVLSSGGAVTVSGARYVADAAKVCVLLLRLSQFDGTVDMPAPAYPAYLQLTCCQSSKISSFSHTPWPASPPRTG